MTYKLDPNVEKIISPVVVHTPDDEEKRYDSGKAAAEAVFNTPLSIKSIRAVDNRVEIQLEEIETPLVPFDGA